MRSQAMALTVVLCCMLPRPVGAQTPSTQPPVADVRITLTDGATRRGKLVDLDDTEVVVLQRGLSQPTRLKLTDVSLVETTPHNTRNFALAGLAAGFGVALIGDWCHADRPYGSATEPDCISAMPALITAAGAALGAAIGHGLDQHQRKVLYRAGPRPRAQAFVFAARRSGAVRLVFSW